MAYSARSIFINLTKQLRSNYHIPNATLCASNNPMNSKDLILQDNKNTDILLSDLKNVTSHDRLFRIVNSHSEVMNQKHIMQAFKSLFEFSKKYMDTAQMAYISVHPSFERMCSGLKRHSRVMDNNEIIEALKILTFLGVKGNSIIFQFLLQLLRENLNNLNLSQIVFLHFILNKCEVSHLADSLKLAMPILFQLNVGLQLDHEDVPKAVDYLKYVTKNNIPEKYVNNIISCLILQSDKIEPEMAKSVIFSLCEVNISWSEHHIQYKKLLNYCFNILSENMDQLSYSDLIRILNFLRDKITNKKECFYHENFLTQSSLYPMQKKLDFINSIQISRVLSRLGFTHFELNDYISNLILQKPENLLNGSPFLIFSYVHSLAVANYKPKCWDTIKMLIVNNPIKKHPKVKIPWSKFVAELAVLDIYDDDFIEKVFSPDFLSEYLDRSNNILDYVQILNIYQAVTAFHPTYSKIIPSPEILNKGYQLTNLKIIDHGMKECLEMTFGGEEFVATNVQMPNGYVIDHIIHFDDLGSPILMPNNQSNVIKYEHLNITNKENAICIINFPKTCYSVNHNRLRGAFDLAIRILEKLEYNVLPISLFDWKNMPDYEKIPFIIREINTKLAIPVNFSNRIT